MPLIMAANEIVSFKSIEISCKRFNEVAGIYHATALRNHNIKISQYLALFNKMKLTKEIISASRVYKELKNLLFEMDKLNAKVSDEEKIKFANLIRSSKQEAQKEIEIYENLKAKFDSISNNDTLITNNNANEDLIQIQMQTDVRSLQLKAQETRLNEVQLLERDVEDLHGIFHDFSQLVHNQGDDVNVIADNAEEALENVKLAENHLRSALKYKKAMYPFVGAVVGTCIGGPIGLVAGIKAGSLAAIGCGVLGFTGGSVLNNSETVMGIEGKKDE